MYISQFQIHNYKSFYESAPVDLGPGFNLVIGQNNVGKTALIQALSLRFAVKPHRSTKSIPLPESSVIDQQSGITVSFTLTNEELKRILLTPSQAFFIPHPTVGKPPANSIAFAGGDPASLSRFLLWFLSLETYTFTARLDIGPG